MPGRKYAAGSLYQYGFNGKENDNEVDGEGGQQDYGMRIYDPRIGRFLSVDPLTNIFPYYTPYQFSGNMPIAAIDLDGMEQYVVIYYTDQNGKLTKIQIRTITDNEGNLQDQKVHKIGHTDQIAKGDVLVFEAKRQKDNTWSMCVVEERNVTNSSLTQQEADLYKTLKKLEKEKNVEESLVYPDLPGQYESEYFNNSDTKSYTADYGLAPPPSKIPAKSPIQKKESVKKPIPPASKVPHVPGVFFKAGGWTVGKGYNDEINGLANWLITNPDYNLEIISGGTGGGEGFTPKSWSEIIPGTTGGKSKGVTMKERLDKLFVQYQADILRAGGGKISADRIKFGYDQPSSNTLFGRPVKKG